MKEIVNKAFSAQILDDEDIFKIVEAISNETAIPEQICAILGALAVRGVKDCEIYAFAKHLKSYSKKPVIKSSGLMDVCGTGGDCLNTFNISTAVSIVAAASGAKIIKHGARSVSSNCGSADVLEELSITIDLENDKLQNMFNALNWAFLYAPNYNETMAKIKKIRNAISAPTLFNLMGPVIHPLDLDYQVIGVYDKKYAKTLANTLNLSGIKHGAVVYGANGLDELFLSEGNIIYEAKNNETTPLKLPELSKLGLKEAKIQDIQAKNKKECAKIISDIFSNNSKNDPKKDIVILNTALCLYVSDIVKNIKEGTELARTTIEEGKALALLERLQNVS
ncbi:MAG: anthranilate phosphoribosyltransferase [Candidatus Gastranaerophilales bacterium]|nr:anthranilate phosphoribosyltransferase [Candidatus Gastranaerophilales bacterium]